jgi:Subtilase family
MSKLIQRRFGLFILALVLALSAAARARTFDTLNWSTNQNRLTADIQTAKLLKVLQQIAATTGWQVFVEPQATNQTVSAKFKELPPAEALRLLLGNLNYALVPEINSSSRLLVFGTTLCAATELVHPGGSANTSSQTNVIPNELIVRLKPGAKIEDIARLLGAKVIGRIDSLNAYRLKFDDPASTDSARQQLAGNPDLTSVDSNYTVGRPMSPTGIASTTVPPPSLTLKPPSDSRHPIVGLVDTAVQPLGNGLDSFLLKAISVAGEAQLDPSVPSHGTSMAETILTSPQAITKGSTSVKILPVDVYGPSASSTTFDVANGIAQAVNGGAKIINLSLGSASDSTFLHDVIKQASSQNIVFFGAAGNTPVITPFHPAAYPEVTAVTAIDQGQLASYANRGSFVSAGAPGTSTVYFNSQPWQVTGTSTSAAYTSGLAAGYMDNKHSTAGQAQTFILNNFGVKIRTSASGQSGN